MLVPVARFIHTLLLKHLKNDRNASHSFDLQIGLLISILLYNVFFLNQSVVRRCHRMKTLSLRKKRRLVGQA